MTAGDKGEDTVNPPLPPDRSPIRTRLRHLQSGTGGQASGTGVGFLPRWGAGSTCLALVERVSECPPQSSQGSFGLGIEVFYPQFLIAQIRFSLKLEAAPKLGVAPLL